MELTQTNPTSGLVGGQTTDTAKNKNEDGAAITSDFETFLRMLTVQLQNQDPLNPVDSSDYAVQLATFSSVEQQVKTNDLLQNLSSQMGLMGMSQFASWVGMEARVSGTAYFDGAPMTLHPPKSTVGDPQLVIYDANKREVYRSDIMGDGSPVVWAGTTPNGQPFQPGVYQFEVQSYSVGQLVDTQSVETYSRIVEARQDDDATLLVLQGGVEIKSSDVTALREG